MQPFVLSPSCTTMFFSSVCLLTQSRFTALAVCLLVLFWAFVLLTVCGTLFFLRMRFLVKKWQKTVARLPSVLKVGGDRVSSGLGHSAQPPAATTAQLRRTGDRHQPEGAVRQHTAAAVVHAPSPATLVTSVASASANGSGGSQYRRQRPLSSCLNSGRADFLTDAGRSTADAHLSSRKSSLAIGASAAASSNLHAAAVVSQVLLSKKPLVLAK